MGGFFAVLLLVLSAVVCQAAPTQNSNPNREVLNLKEHLTSETAALIPTFEPLLPTVSASPAHSSPPSSPPFIQPQQSPPKPTPCAASQVPLCPLKCQALSVPLLQTQQPAKKKTCWLVNLFNKCVEAVVNSLTDLIVITGEKNPSKSGNSNIFISFGKKGSASKQLKNGAASNLDSNDARAGNVSCFWYKDYRFPAPRTRIASYITNSSGRGTQCNFCCVGHKVIDCSNCLTINCNPTINCCSCTVNITVMNNMNSTGQQNQLVLPSAE